MGGGVVTWVVCTGGTTEAGLPARRTYHIRTMYTIIYVLNQLHDTNKRVRRGRKIPKYVYVKAYKFQMIEEKNMVRCTASWSFCIVRTKNWCVISTKWFLSGCNRACRQRFTNSFVVKIVFVAMVTYGCLIFGEHGYANKKRGQIHCLEQNELFASQGMLY